MAIKVANTPAEGFKYIPMREKGEQNPFTVWIRPIGTRDLLHLEDMIVSRKEDPEGNSVHYSQGIFAFRLVQQGLLKWDNIEGADGKPLDLKFEDGVAAADSVAYIAAEYLIEISAVISSITRDPANIQIFISE